VPKHSRNCERLFQNTARRRRKEKGANFLHSGDDPGCGDRLGGEEITGQNIKGSRGPFRKKKANNNGEWGKEE